MRGNPGGRLRRSNEDRDLRGGARERESFPTPGDGHDLTFLETLLADHVLLRMRNVVITSHSGFNTREAVQRILDVTAENIRGFLEGKPRNVVS